jgi:hypothetical protein
MPETQVHSFSWEKVFDLMSEAIATHKPRIYSSPVLSIRGDLASQYIDLISNEYCLGMLKGGLALIFEVRFRFRALSMLTTFLDHSPG